MNGEQIEGLKGEGGTNILMGEREQNLDEGERSQPNF